MVMECRKERHAQVRLNDGHESQDHHPKAILTIGQRGVPQKLDDHVSFSVDSYGSVHGTKAEEPTDNKWLPKFDSRDCQLCLACRVSAAFEWHSVEVKVNAPQGSSELNHVRRPKTRDTIESSSFSSFWFCSSIAVNFCLLAGNASATNGATAPMKGKSSMVSSRSVGLASNAYTNESTLPIQSIIVNENIVMVPM